MYSNCYDRYFQRGAQEFFGDRLHWLWFKAQAVAESSLNPEAGSPAGALGVMQLMPGTAAEMAAKHPGEDGTILLPHINIRLGIAYDRHCFDIWREEAGRERVRYMLGSYNAGSGHIVKAQRLAVRKGLPADQWASIAACLPEVTGRHATETITYVQRVERLFGRLAATGSSK